MQPSYDPREYLGFFPVMLAGALPLVPGSPEPAADVPSTPGSEDEAAEHSMCRLSLLARTCTVDLAEAIASGNHHALTDPVGLALQGGLRMGTLAGLPGRGNGQYRAAGEVTRFVLRQRPVIVTATLNDPPASSAGSGGGADGTAEVVAGEGRGEGVRVSFCTQAADWTGRSSLSWICSGALRGYVSETQYQHDLAAAQALAAGAAADGVARTRGGYSEATRRAAIEAGVLEQGVCAAAVSMLRAEETRNGQATCCANVRECDEVPPRGRVMCVCGMLYATYMTLLTPRSDNACTLACGVRAT